MTPHELSKKWRESLVNKGSGSRAIRKRKVEPKAMNLIETRGWTIECLYDIIVDLLEEIEFMSEGKK